MNKRHALEILKLMLALAADLLIATAMTPGNV